jgi:hypothetical protein
VVTYARRCAGTAGGYALNFVPPPELAGILRRMNIAAGSDTSTEGGAESWQDAAKALIRQRSNHAFNDFRLAVRPIYALYGPGPNPPPTALGYRRTAADRRQRSHGDGGACT